MAALYDPRYDYPNKRRQSFIGSLRDLDKRNEYLRKLHPDTVPPAQAAPALTPSHLTGTKMGSAPPALTEAQLHARRTEPAVNMHYDANNNLVPANTASINAYQGDIVSDNTDETGDYTEEAKKELFGPTANEISDNRRSGIMMNQDPARYAPDGSDLDDGMGNIYSLEGGDKDDVFQSLVKRYLDEGFGREESIAKAEAQMEKSRLQLFKENSAELGTFMMDKLGPEGERNYWPYIPFADTKLGRNGLVINGFDGEQIAKLGGEDAKVTEAREALPSMQDAQRMLDINDPIGRTGGALTSPSTDTRTGNGTGNTVVTKDNGALTASSKPTQSTVRSTTGGYTGNARGSDLPDMQIGLNERLMRMGAAGLAAGGQGSLAQMGAMFGASANVNQLNRQAEMEAFGIEEERRQAHAARVAALAASKNKGADAATDFSSMASSLTEMEGLYAMLGQENLTGPLMGTVGKWAEGAGLFDFFRDKPKDAMKAYARFQLQGLKVDDTLLRVAQTKGAISDAEMKLFQSDTPSMTDSEGVWQRYLNERMVVLRKALAAQGYALNAPVKIGGATITSIAAQ